MNQSLNDSIIIEKDKKTNGNKALFVNEESLTNKTDAIILEALLKIQPATRMDLCSKTGIPRTTIYDALTRLILRKMVRKYSTPGKTKGRPKVFYRTV